MRVQTEDWRLRGQGGLLVRKKNAQETYASYYKQTIFVGFFIGFLIGFFIGCYGCVGKVLASVIVTSSAVSSLLPQFTTTFLSNVRHNMGIQGLTSLLGDVCPHVLKNHEIKNYFGRKIAVDASMFLYSFLVAIRPDSQHMLTDASGEATRHLSFLVLSILFSLTRPGSSSHNHSVCFSL